MLKKTLVVFFFTYLTSFSTASDELEIVVSWHKPPYVLMDQDSGFELDLARAIFNEMGYTLKPNYLPFGRIERTVAGGKMDVALTLNNRHSVDRAILTDEYVRFQNVAVTLADSQIDINRISDLSNYRVVGFQTASRVLGEEFALMTQSNANYTEVADQRAQVITMLRGNFDVAVMDRNIYQWISATLPDNIQQPTKIHNLFALNGFRAAIPDPQMRSTFNAILHRFMQDGRYKMLLDKYYLENLFGEQVKSPTQALED